MTAHDCTRAAAWQRRLCERRRACTPAPHRLALSVMCALLVVSQARVAAQSQAGAGAEQATSGFGESFFIQSADGRNRLSVGALMQFDGRFVLADPSPITNTFSMRRVRAGFTARLADVFELRFNPEFGGGQVFIQDMYLDMLMSDAIRVRVGKYKVPLGYEMLIVAPRILMPERSLANNLVPNRDVGAQVMGDVAGGRLSYAGGIFNGGPDGGSALDADTNGAKDLLGWVEVRPFRKAGGSSHPAQGLGLRVGASVGEEQGPLLPFRTSVLQTYFAYAAGAEATGQRRRVTPSVNYWYRSFGGFAEYFRTTQTVSWRDAGLEHTNTGWAVTGSVLLTGETASTGPTRPAHDLDLHAHHWGAVQVVVPYSVTAIDPAAFEAGLAAAGSSRRTTQASVGLNWYATPFIKYVAMVERTGFDAPSRRPVEMAVMVRTQVAF